MKTRNRSSQDHSERGILHAHFNGNCPRRLFLARIENLGDQIADAESNQMQQQHRRDYHGQTDSTGSGGCCCCCCSSGTISTAKHERKR